MVAHEEDVFGDAVNLASRLCDLASKGQTVTDEDTARRLSDRYAPSLRKLFSVPVKGKAQEEPVFALHGEARAGDGFEDFLAAHEQVLAARDQVGFDAALAATRVFPQAASYAAFYARRRAALAAVSPGS